MEMSFEDIIKFLDSLIVPIIVGILSAGLTKASGQTHIGFCRIPV